MRKLLTLLTFLILAVPAVAAENVLFSFGKLNLLMPLVNVDAVYLWDTVEQRGLAGAETKLWEYRKLSGTIGAVLDQSNQGTPYIGLDIPVDVDVVGVSGLRFGVWFAYDFHQEHAMGGIKSSIKLWGGQ